MKMLEKQKEFPDRIYDGLVEIKRRLQRNELVLDPEDVYFYRQISVADVENFASLINEEI